MSENAASPKRGLFQSLSKRVSGYRNKKRDDPSSPRSHASETTSEGQRSVDDVDMLGVQVSGKSARSARRLTSRPCLSHLKSAPAGALQAAAEQALADNLAASPAPMYARVSEDYSNHSSAYSPQSARARYNRSQSHMDIPKQGSTAITPDTVASSSSSGQLMPFAHADGHGSTYLVSPAAAPAVQQAAAAQQSATAQEGSMQSETRRMSRKISGNKLILSDDGNLEAKDGEFMLPPEATPFAQTGRAAFDDLEICFSGKSARMSRGGMRRPDMHTIAAH